LFYQWRFWGVGFGMALVACSGWFVLVFVEDFILMRLSVVL
jgi:hypothetical protein